MRKLPISLYGLFAWVAVSIIVGIGSVSFFVMKNGAAGNISYAAEAIRARFFGSELERRTKDLDVTIAKLQKKHDEAKRLNARVEDRLQRLEGVLGNVTEDPKVAKDKKSAKLFKPASFIASEQIQSIKKLNRIESEIRMLPVGAPVKNGIITSGFGPRGSIAGRGAHFHRGVDISFRGTSRSVYATGAGVVKEVNTMSGYGLYVDIQHARNVVTRYAHLSAAQVRKGQKIQQGQLIAIGGSSGSTTGAHLHYEIYVRGRARDPQQFLGLPKKLQMVLKSGLPAKG